MNMSASGAKLSIPVVASGAVPAVVPAAVTPSAAVPIVATPAVTPVLLATGPKSMLNTAKSWLGLGGRGRSRRGRKAATRRRGRKGASRRRGRGRKSASRRH